MIDLYTAPTPNGWKASWAPEALAIPHEVHAVEPIAVIADWCRVRTHEWSGISIEGLDGSSRWLDAIRARPAAERRVAVPIQIPKFASDDDPESAEAFAKNARSILQK